MENNKQFEKYSELTLRKMNIALSMKYKPAMELMTIQRDIRIKFKFLSSLFKASLISHENFMIARNFLTTEKRHAEEEFDMLNLDRYIHEIITKRIKREKSKP